MLCFALICFARAARRLPLHISLSRPALLCLTATRRPAPQERAAAATVEAEAHQRAKAAEAAEAEVAAAREKAALGAKARREFPCAPSPRSPLGALLCLPGPRLRPAPLASRLASPRYASSSPLASSLRPASSRPLPLCWRRLLLDSSPPRRRGYRKSPRRCLREREDERGGASRRAILCERLRGRR